MQRIDGRRSWELRPVLITRNFNKYAEGSVLIEMGGTRVICTASVDDKVPPFLKGGTKGWVTAEYGMLPRSTNVRNVREVTKGRLDGRTSEIQRLIGRALRAVVDLEAIGERTIVLDCDVIQADGGTRTASITGAFVALVDALNTLVHQGNLKKLPIKDFVAAISVGILDSEPVVDLCFAEDSAAQVDMNVVMTGKGHFVEVQGTGEEASFTRAEMNQMLDMAAAGIQELIAYQQKILGPLAERIGR